MSSLSLKSAAHLCPLILSAASLVPINLYANTQSNDLLRHELWGLQSTARASESSQTGFFSWFSPEKGTCAEKPDIVNNAYTCDSYTPPVVEDVDINAPEGWAAYVPSSNLDNNEVVIALIDTGMDYTHPDLAAKAWVNPGEATGIDSDNNGIDDGCEDDIDGDNNGYLNDCHGVNVLVPRQNPDGTLNPLAGDPLDDEVGHGTNMAGVMAAIANNADANYHGGMVGVTGFEPRIKIASCKSAKFETDALVYIPGIPVPAAAESALVDCLWYFYNLKQSGVNIAAINASGGMSKYMNFNDLLYPLIASQYHLDTSKMYMLADLLEAEDIPVVAAAGNNGWSIDQLVEERAYFPAAFTNSNIIAVGATNNQGEMWRWSSYGRWSVDVMAPGQDILSTVPSYPLFPEDTADFVVTHGTSQATAFVTGIVALLKANQSTQHLDAASIRRLLMSSGKPIPEAKDKSVSGALVRMADHNGKGALTCQDQLFRRRQAPNSDSIVALPGETVVLEVQSFNCAGPNTEDQVQVTVNETGEIINLYDDGIGQDETAGDGVFSGVWMVPYGQLQFTLSSGYDSVLDAEDTLSVQATIIEDNLGNTHKTGKWWSSFFRPGFYGSNYRVATRYYPEKIFTWSPGINSSGYYEVYARWPQGPFFANNATYRIHHQSTADGSHQVTEVVKNQNRDGGQWVSLGQFWFDAGVRTVELTSKGADGTVAADAIRLVPRQ